jgi:UDP-2,4-diacetamido-2,4,6-trideoxy-beta-L-altropyranose hydrolase
MPVSASAESMKTITIFTEAGSAYGFGHLSRCVALADAFSEAGYMSLFILKGDREVSALCKMHSFRFLDWHAQEFDLLSDFPTLSISVIDSYHASFRLCEKIRQISDLIIFFDDYMRIDYPPGIVVNAAPDASEIGYPKKIGTRYLLGPRFQPLRKTFWSRPAKPIHKNIENILVVMGGADPRNIIPQLVAHIKKNFPGPDKNIIISSSFSNQDQILDLADKKTRIIRDPSEDDLADIYLQSDIAIASGGQVISELARFDIPPVTIGIAENQRSNLVSWQKCGFTDFAGWWDDPSLLDHITDYIRNISSDMALFRTRAALGSKIIDGGGARRIVKEVIEIDQTAHAI